MSTKNRWVWWAIIPSGLYGKSFERNGAPHAGAKVVRIGGFYATASEANTAALEWLKTASETSTNVQIIVLEASHSLNVNVSVSEEPA